MDKIFPCPSHARRTADYGLALNPIGSSHFATTHWSLVASAGRESSPLARAALAQLCQTYWYPLYVYVRRKGRSAEDAQDLTQSFFARLLEKGVLKLADRELGKLRSFLLASLDHFLANEWRKAAAEKRGGGQRSLSLDFDSAEERLRREPVDETTPERLYERRWALTVLKSALADLKDQYTAGGRAELFDKLLPMLEGEKQSYAAIADEIGMTESAVKMAVHRLRKSYRLCLREQVARTVADPAHVDEELDAMMAALRG